MTEQSSQKSLTNNKISKPNEVSNTLASYISSLQNNQKSYINNQIKREAQDKAGA